MGIATAIILSAGVGSVLYHELVFLEYYRLPPVSFVKNEQERTSLFDGIYSYQSVEEFKSTPRYRSHSWTESDNGSNSPRGRPPYRFHTLTAEIYVQRGNVGLLQVVFFNNRLIATSFYPSDVSSFVDSLRREGLNLDPGQKTLIGSYTRLRFVNEPKGHHYFDWSDIRLDSEVVLWVKRYS